MDAVEPDEPLACYLVHASDFVPSRGILKYSAFMPARNGRKSVYRSVGLDEAAIREIGRQYVEPQRGPLKGFASFSARSVNDAELSVMPDPVPHPRHANILGWALDRAANRIKAEKLAACAAATIY